MKFLEIFRFEVGYQLRRPLVWGLFVALLGLTFLIEMSYVDNAREGESFMNSPLILAAMTAFSSMFSLLFLAALASDAAIRDIQARMDPLLYTTSLSQLTFLGGRFLGVFFTASLLILPVVAVGLVGIRFLPEIEPAFYGPVRPLAYLSSTVFFTLPNLFVATALIYACVLLSRQAMAGYVVAVLIFLLSTFSMDAMAGYLNMWELGKLLDFSGLTVVKELRMKWTPQQLHTQMVSLEGSLVANRLLWLGIASGIFVLAFIRFQFVHYVGGSSWFSFWKKKQGSNTIAPIGMEQHALVPLPVVQRPFTSATRLRQVVYMTQSYFREMVTGWGLLAILAMVYFVCVIVPELMEGPLGVPLLPTTGVITGVLGHMIVQSFVAMLIMLYAGQLVWRERDSRLSDLIDSAPVPDRVVLISKCLALVLLILFVQLVLTITAIGIQASLGYYQFEPGLYLQTFFGLHLVNYLLIAAVAIALHILINQKYLAHMILLVLYAYSVMPDEFGIEHKLLIWGSDLGYSFSDMRGFSPYLTPWLWFKLYWAGWALLFVVVAKLFLVRGRELAFRQRLQLMRARTTRPMVLLLTGCCVVIISAGAFIFYNTNILNDYTPANEREAARAAYEQVLGRYQGVPQPLLTDTRLHVEVYPERQEVVVQGTYQLKNQTQTAIDTLHLATASEVITSAIVLNRKAREVPLAKSLDHRMFVFDKPLQPGDSLQLQFKVHFLPKGFRNSGVVTEVTTNGTYFSNHDWLPAIGYQSDRELGSAAQRKAYGLAQQPRYRSLYDTQAQQDKAGRERIQLELTIGTASDQTAVAPGALVKRWTENNRQYFQYKTEQPIRNGYAILSARFAEHSTTWKGIRLQIFHHPEHTHNLDRMMKSLQASLEYHTKNFGPYPHQQLKLVQYQGKGSLTSFPGLITYPESFALLTPDKDWRNFDLPYAVVAHEVAHQWWGNQVIPASIEGAPFISESLAWYSALGVVQQSLGTAHMRRLLEVMQDSYLTPRSRAGVPLLRTTDHFMAYRKGPFAMHALREYIGEEQVNSALQQLLQRYGTGVAPLAISTDLYNELETITPDSLQYLLSDLLKVNTFWTLKTKNVWAEPAGDDSWLVTLDVQAHKHDVDSAGTEKEVALNDFVEIGIFTEAAEDEVEKPMYLQTHRIHSGEQRITVKVPRKPVRAGIDPRNLLIDTKMIDNIEVVSSDEKPRQLAADTNRNKVIEKAQTEVH